MRVCGGVGVGVGVGESLAGGYVSVGGWEGGGKVSGWL